MQHKKFVPACVALLVLLISSCGWHLRGTSAPGTSDALSNPAFGFSLTADDVYTPLYQVFKSDYENRRIDLTSADNRPQLKLMGEKVKNRILSLNTELDTAESQLDYAVHYQIIFPGQPPQIYNIELFRTYTQNKNRAVARDNEKNKLIDEMRHEAADRILTQIALLMAQQK